MLLLPVFAQSLTVVPRGDHKGVRHFPLDLQPFQKPADGCVHEGDLPVVGVLGEAGGEGLGCAVLVVGIVVMNPEEKGPLCLARGFQG